MRLLAHLFSCLSSHLVFIKGGLCYCSNASMVRWFVSVSYVFSGWSYIQGDCSGWLHMHFGEMDHLPYRHARFVPFLPWWFSSDQQFLFSDGRFAASTCFSDAAPTWSFSCSCLREHLHCTWVPNMASLPGPNSSHLILHFLSFVGLRHFPKLHLRGGVRVNN